MSSVEQRPQAGVTCPRCECPDSRVLQTRRRVLRVNGQDVGGIRRERECDHCKKRFWTSEATS